MSMSFHLDIVSASDSIFSGLATMVFAPAVDGEIGIMPRHAPLLTTLKPGMVRIQADNKEEKNIFVSGGILEIQPNIVTILSDTAIRAQDLDEAAAMRAKEQAQSAIDNKQSDFEYAKAKTELIQAIAQIESIRKIKKRNR
ncbi:MAG: F0F1 ATP synthase subunit epsilon [Gammaproteobacteria bacterium]|nr:MAG: F0F1 ATP synthase subunit epsilon [Gammaproteobacteria bacterium]